MNEALKSFEQLAQEPASGCGGHRPRIRLKWPVDAEIPKRRTASQTMETKSVASIKIAVVGQQSSCHQLIFITSIIMSLVSSSLVTGRAFIQSAPKSTSPNRYAVTPPIAQLISTSSAMQQQTSQQLQHDDPATRVVWPFAYPSARLVYPRSSPLADQQQRSLKLTQSTMSSEQSTKRILSIH